jgi:hypothetical protein
MAPRARTAAPAVILGCLLLTPVTLAFAETPAHAAHTKPVEQLTPPDTTGTSANSTAGTANSDAILLSVAGATVVVAGLLGASVLRKRQA